MHLLDNKVFYVQEIHVSLELDTKISGTLHEDLKYFVLPTATCEVQQYKTKSIVQVPWHNFFSNNKGACGVILNKMIVQKRSLRGV